MAISNDLDDATRFTISDDLMVPRMKAGSIIYTNPLRGPEVGDDVLCQVMTDTGVVQWLVRELTDMDQDTVEIMQLNPVRKVRVARERLIDIDPVMWIGRPEQGSRH